MIDWLIVTLLFLIVVPCIIIVQQMIKKDSFCQRHPIAYGTLLTISVYALVALYFIYPPK